MSKAFGAVTQDDVQTHRTIGDVKVFKADKKKNVLENKLMRLKCHYVNIYTHKNVTKINLTAELKRNQLI